MITSLPIWDTEAILETLADYAPTVKDLDMLTEYVARPSSGRSPTALPRPGS